MKIGAQALAANTSVPSATTTTAPIRRQRAAWTDTRLPSAVPTADRTTGLWGKSPALTGNWRTAFRGRSASGLLGGLEDDDRDLPVGLLLVLVVVGPLGRHRLPELGLLLRRGVAGRDLEPMSLALELSLGIRLQVQVPGGWGGRTALGRDHQVVAGVLAVDERCLPLLP